MRTAVTHLAPRASMSRRRGMGVMKTSASICSRGVGVGWGGWGGGLEGAASGGMSSSASNQQTAAERGGLCERQLAPAATMAALHTWAATHTAARTHSHTHTQAAPHRARRRDNTFRQGRGGVARGSSCLAKSVDCPQQPVLLGCGGRSCAGGVPAVGGWVGGRAGGRWVVGVCRRGPCSGWVDGVGGVGGWWGSTHI